MPLSAASRADCACAVAAAQYTFRNEHVFFANNFKTINDEYQAALDVGVDGLFTDYTEGAYQVHMHCFITKVWRVAHQEEQALQNVEAPTHVGASRESVGK